MNYNLIDEKNHAYLVENKLCEFDDIKDHTRAKIDYVSNYVIEWLRVASNDKNSKRICFVDAMSNCGIYKKLDFCTCLRILDIFYLESIKYPGKDYFIYLNDIDSDKINVLKEIISYYKNKLIKRTNLHIDIRNKDAAVFLDLISGCMKFGYNPSERNYILLYVDPYNFPNKDIIVATKKFVSTIYCELLFNFFTSDIERNLFNESQKNKSDEIIDSLQLFTDIEYLSNIYYHDRIYIIMEHFFKYISDNTNIKHYFSYGFDITTHKEIYQILYFTPNIKGLEQLKKALWISFDGHPEYWSKNESKYEKISLTGNSEKDQRAEDYGAQAQELIIKLYSGIISYGTIKELVIHKTMLMEGQIIKNVIKPLIEKRKLLKLNIYGKSNYKKDEYKLL